MGHGQGQSTRVQVLRPWEMLGTKSCIPGRCWGQDPAAARGQEPLKPHPGVAGGNLVHEGQGDVVRQEQAPAEPCCCLPAPGTAQNAWLRPGCHAWHNQRQPQRVAPLTHTHGPRETLWGR